MSPAGDQALRRALRGSRVFDDALKRSWLSALPYMAPDHKAELAAILAIERDDDEGDHAGARERQPDGRDGPRGG